MPENVVFTYQGDGDLAAIGTAEIIHAANRGEKITTIFINNAIYGMTGGQMAPTTLLGMKTTTSPYGRSAENEGYPLHMAEMLSNLPGVAFLARTKVNKPQDVLKTKKLIKKAFLAQIQGKGFGMVEVLSTCPTNWGIPPVEANKWLEENLVPEFPLGVYVDKVGDEK
jgi:2-oxoglutarate ferredoxin oxidoreductase subunit beta